MSEIAQREMPFNGHEPPPTLGVWPAPVKKFITEVIESNPNFFDCVEDRGLNQKNEGNHAW